MLLPSIIPNSIGLFKCSRTYFPQHFISSMLVYYLLLAILLKLKLKYYCELVLK